MGSYKRDDPKWVSGRRKAERWQEPVPNFCRFGGGGFEPQPATSGGTQSNKQKRNHIGGYDNGNNE